MYEEADLDIGKAITSVLEYQEGYAGQEDVKILKAKRLEELAKIGQDLYFTMKTDEELALEQLEKFENRQNIANKSDSSINLDHQKNNGDNNQKLGEVKTVGFKKRKNKKKKKSASLIMPST